MKRTKVIKKDKPINTSKINSLVAIANTQEERYEKLCQWREWPVSEMFIERLALEIMKWADLPSSRRIADFCNARGLSRMTLFNWKNKYPNLGAAYTYAIETIGSRREDGIIDGSWGAHTAHVLPQYEPVWCAQEDKIQSNKEKLATITKNVNGTPQTITVITQKAQDCPEVPHAPPRVKATNDGS